MELIQFGTATVGYVLAFSVSSTLRLLPFLIKFIFVFERLMAEAAIHLGQKSLCVHQYLGDWLIKGSLEQCALQQMRTPFISASLGLTEQHPKHRENAGLEWIHTHETRAVQIIFNKRKICGSKNIPCKYNNFNEDVMEKVLECMIC